MKALLLGSALIAIVVSCGGSDDEAATDPRQQAQSYARDDISCTTADDCCVVFDGCKGQGLVVGAADQAKVASLLEAAPEDACVKCVPPAIDVQCVGGKCTGVAMVPPAGGDPTGVPEAMKNHCGALTFPSGWTQKPQSLPPDLPGSSAQTILGC